MGSHRVPDLQNVNQHLFNQDHLLAPPRVNISSASLLEAADIKFRSWDSEGQGSHLESFSSRGEKGSAIRNLILQRKS